VKPWPVGDGQCGQLSVWEGQIDECLYGVEDGGRRLSCDEDQLAVRVDDESVGVTDTSSDVDSAEL